MCSKQCIERIKAFEEYNNSREQKLNKLTKENSILLEKINLLEEQNKTYKTRLNLAEDKLSNYNKDNYSQQDNDEGTSYTYKNN